ncbi:MAG: hypothetical protein WC644_02855 [Ignavibacteria bacterium]
MKTKTLLFSLMLQLLFSYYAYPQWVFWEENNSGVTVSLNAVSNLNGQNAYVCGDSGTVLKTNYFGYNWSKVSTNEIPSDVSLGTLFALTTAAVFTGGTNDSGAVMYMTTTSGTNWLKVFTQAGTEINGIWLYNTSEGIMVGNPVGGRWSIWKTTNGGFNWDSTGCYLKQNVNETGFRNSFYYASGKMWFGTNNSRIYYSSNNGTNWSVISTEPMQNSISLWWLNEMLTYGYTTGSSYLKTTNAGLNWLADTSVLGSGNINGIISYPNFNTNPWYIRNSENIYLKNGFQGWIIQYTAPSGIYNYMGLARSGSFFGPGAIFAVRNNGGISRANAFVEGVKLISDRIPDDYKLHQNYPNPFNSTTHFKFDTRLLPNTYYGEVRGGNIKLTIYNALGQEVETLINKVLQPAVYEASWNGSNYSSGVYFYRFQVTDPNGGGIVYNAVKKMIMMK